MKKKLKQDHPELIRIVRKGFLIMRLFLFLMILGVLHSTASVSQTKRFNLNEKNISFKEVLKLIEEQSEFRFFYDEDKLNVDEKLTINMNNSSIEEVLDQLSKQTGIKFKILDNNFIVLKSKNNTGEIQSIAQQQSKTISGKVTDSSGALLPGVTIVIKGTAQGTITDADGKYNLAKVPRDATLVFSFVGMKTQEIAVAGKTSVNVAMEETTIGIEEVVAVGYGTMKKSDITGSISSVPMDLAKNQPVRGLGDLLQGRVAGITLTTTSGDITGSSKIRVRGINSIKGDNSPLYVVDGVIGNSMGSIHDVASVEILKDASATAIYGERASNGVILITTKHATSSKPVINVSLNTGFQFQNTDYKDKMNAAEYAATVNDIYESTIFSDSDIAGFKESGGTDWADLVMQTAIVNDHNISYSQKKDKMGVYISGRFTNAEGAMINSKSGGNYSFRTKIDLEPAKNLTVSLDVKANRSRRKNGGNSTSTDKSDPLFQALIWSPTEPVWSDEASGSYNTNDNYGSLLYNPYMTAMEQQYFSISHGIYATLDAKYKIADWLTYHITGFTSKTAGNSGEYENEWLESDDPDASRNSYDNSSWRLINQIDFHKTFNDVHNVSATAVYEAEEAEGWSLYGYGRELPMPDLSSYYNVGMSNIQETSSSYSNSSRVSFLGRLNYNYMLRYYFTASYRLDAQSGPTNRVDENKWGGFPSFAASWRISEEPFMQDGFFDNLKLRLGWGLTGNPSGFPYTGMSKHSYNYGTGADILGYTPGTPANPNLKWEETSQTNVGLDVTILKGRLSFAFDYFKKETTDLLTDVELPMYYGYGTDASYTQNLGKIKNTGYEATVDYTPVQTNDLVWKLNFNISRVKNEVMDLGAQNAFLTGTTGDGLISAETYRVAEGLPLGTMWGYKCLGIWSTDEATEAAKYGEQPGDYKYEDVNNDGAINLDDDGQKIGDSNPDFTWGLSSALSYKNFDFSILLQGVRGQNVFNIMRGVMASKHADSRMIMLKGPAMDYWTTDNQDSKWPNIHSSSNTKRLNSSKWIENGSWVKIKSIGVTYNFPRRWIKFGDMSFTVSGQNLLTISKYKGYDPEVSASGGNDLWGGCDLGTIPIPKRITLGVDLTF